jgi:hypothetical protein
MENYIEIMIGQPKFKKMETKKWYKNGQAHRDNDLAAIIDKNGDHYWFKNNGLHRDNDLAAIIYYDGRQCWYKNGVQYYPI